MLRRQYNLPTLLGAMLLASLSTLGVVRGFQPGIATGRLLWRSDAATFAATHDAVDRMGRDVWQTMVRKAKDARTEQIVLFAEMREVEPSPGGR